MTEEIFDLDYDLLEDPQYRKMVSSMVEEVVERVFAPFAAFVKEGQTTEQIEAGMRIGAVYFRVLCICMMALTLRKGDGGSFEYPQLFTTCAKEYTALDAILEKIIVEHVSHITRSIN